MRATEHHFQSPEQVRQYLFEALAVVAELDPPDDLRVAAFTQAATMIAAKQVFFEQPQQVPLDPRLAATIRTRH